MPAKVETSKAAESKAAKSKAAKSTAAKTKTPAAKAPARKAVTLRSPEAPQKKQATTRGAQQKGTFKKLLSFDNKMLEKFQPPVVELIIKGKGGSRTTIVGTNPQQQLFSGAASGLIGVDEVGRGCLAGPVVAAAVMLPALRNDSALAKELRDLNDSKQLTATQRETFAQVIRGCGWFAIAEASPEEIDEINILQASLLAMKRAIWKLEKMVPQSLEESLILIDGNRPLEGLSGVQHSVIKGDSRSASIAAASVVAKVYRDDLMAKLHDEFPRYNWRSNKGYPSIEHRRAIEEVGTCKWHRMSFSFKSVLTEDDDNAGQEG